MKNVIWDATLDNRYECSVERISEYGGNLRVFDIKTSSVLLEEEVPLAYGAKFGPDMEDIIQWQNKVVDLIDGKN